MRVISKEALLYFVKTKNVNVNLLIQAHAG